MDNIVKQDSELQHLKTSGEKRYSIMTSILDIWDTYIEDNGSMLTGVRYLYPAQQNQQVSLQSKLLQVWTII